MMVGYILFLMMFFANLWAVTMSTHSNEDESALIVAKVVEEEQKGYSVPVTRRQSNFSELSSHRERDSRLNIALFDIYPSHLAPHLVTLPMI